jgi:RNA polymerase subunit RPABC4/transcription elongation factor Spt4
LPVIIDKKYLEVITMFCKNCGNEVNQTAEFCTNCGSRPLSEKSFCQGCGTSVNENQEVCIQCGVNLKTQANNINASTDGNDKAFCRNCGNEVNKNAEICVSCGSRPLNGKSFCQSCGTNTNENQEICIKCGVRLLNKSNTYNSSNGAYLKPYYEEEFERISTSNEDYKGKWNWCAFFFSWIWAFTKGLWGMALANLVLNLILASTGVGLIISLAISILWGIRGNYFYYNLQINKKQFPSTL